MRTYSLWTEEHIEELRQDTKDAPLIMTEAIIGLIREANNRHEVRMLKKDIEIAELKGQLK